MKKVMVVFGTRPEAIKMCPLVLELKKHPQIDCRVCLTGQHREMLQQVMDVFQIQEDYNLHVMQEGQSLTGITNKVLDGLEQVFKNDRPDLVLVHGDTTTSFAAALAAFYQQIPVGHVEAGLRSGNKYSPCPEEINRELISHIAEYHFAPTKGNAENLKREGITNNVFITGNTVIDSFKYTIKDDYKFHNEMLNKVELKNKRIILMTAHRRENLGQPLENICNAVKRIAEKYDDLVVIYAVHPNPKVSQPVHKILGKTRNVVLTDPLDVLDMHNLMGKSYLILTDSGGLQEEAPALGKPVLVARTETERPEAIDAGTVKLVGVDKEIIETSLEELLDDNTAYERMAKSVNPYGDGKASERIVEIILKELKG